MKITEGRLRQLIREEAAHETQVALMKWLSQQAIRLGVADHTYVVGGAVRNFVIKQPIKDIDMMIDSVALKGKDSEWLAKRLQKAIPARSNLTTNQYGVAILTVKGPWTLGGSDMQGEVIEIANARKESYGGTGGKGYKPSEVVPATAADDIKRREFTFNTLMWRLSQLAKGPDKAEIVDLTGCGLADLKAGVMACPSDPDKTFSDDPTRMLRAIKFLVKYGFRIRGDVENSIRRNAGKLRNVPPNALTTILIDTLLKDPKSAKKSLKEMKRLGLLDILADLMRSDQQFGATMQKWANNRKVLFLFDMMDMGLPMNARLDFLSPEQQARLRKVALLMPEGEPESYLDALKQPGKAMQDKRFIPSMAKERGLKGKAFGQFAKRASDRARDLMLDNPALWKNPAQLRQRVRSAVAEATVLNMKITEKNKTMRITEKKLRQLIREEISDQTRDPIDRIRLIDTRPLVEPMDKKIQQVEYIGDEAEPTEWAADVDSWDIDLWEAGRNTYYVAFLPEDIVLPRKRHTLEAPMGWYIRMISTLMNDGRPRFEGPFETKEAAKSWADGAFDLSFDEDFSDPPDTWE